MYIKIYHFRDYLHLYMLSYHKIFHLRLSWKHFVLISLKDSFKNLSYQEYTGTMGEQIG